MKIKNYLISGLFLVASVGSTVLYTSCQKEQVKIENEVSTDGILRFETFEEYKEQRKAFENISTEELKAFEAQKGYKSFGLKCDEFYESIDFEKFDDVNDLKAYVVENESYLEFNEDEGGDFLLETKFSNNAFRYMINEDRVVIIEHTAIKVFSSGVVSTSIKKLNELKKIEEKDLLFLDKKTFTYSPLDKVKKDELKDATFDCGQTASNYKLGGGKKNKSYKIMIDLYFTVSTIYDDLGVPIVNFLSPNLRVKCKKRLFEGHYINERHTLSYMARAVVDVEYKIGNKSSMVRKNYYSTNSGTVSDNLVCSFDEIEIPSAYIFDYHWAGYHCWGDAPDVSKVWLECNYDLVYGQ